MNGRDGTNGKDGSPDTGEQIVTKLVGLTGDDRLPASAIRDLPEQPDTPEGVEGDFVEADVGAINVAQPFIRIANDLTGISWDTPMVSLNIDDLRGRQLLIYSSAATKLTAPVRIIFDYQGGTANYEKPDTFFTILNLTDQPVEQWYGANGTGDGAVRAGQIQASVGPNLQAFVNMDVVSGVAIGTIRHADVVPP